MQQIAYADLSVPVRREIAILQDRAYGPSDSADIDLGSLHDPSLRAQSFMVRSNGRLVSYVGVVTTMIHVGELAFVASGLSCVATDPAFARRGYARRAVAAATRFIESSEVDLGVFTCAPPLATLYSEAGGWVVEPDAVLIGSVDMDALTSTSLGVVVLMRLFSPQALAHANTIHHGTIDLGLPVGQFW